jgi:hypothetical protein
MLERLRDYTAVIPRDHEDAQAYLQAIVDHTERREREAQAEAEDGGVVLLEARDLQADIRLFKDNRLLLFKPQLAIGDHRGESPYQDIGSYRIIQAPRPTEAEITRGRGRGKKPQVSPSRTETASTSWLGNSISTPHMLTSTILRKSRWP